MDKVKVVIEFPAGLICTDSDGDNHAAVAEFQIFLKYYYLLVDSKQNLLGKLENHN